MNQRHAPPLNIFDSKEISMNTVAKSILVSSILSIGLTASMVAQPGTAQYEQWYRAKYGRPSPAAQATPKTTQASSTSTEATQPTVAVTQFEHWYRAKYGRPSPTEQALTQAAPLSTTMQAMPPITMPLVLSDKDVAANTPAEHQRIAQGYRDQAQNYLAQAKEHEAMLAAYKGSPNITSKNQAATINHCEYFVTKFHEMATKSQQLAQLHAEMAKAATKN
jgi:hypothetical protein